MKFKRKNNIVEAEQWFPGKKMTIENVVTSPVLEPTAYNLSGEYGQIRQEDGSYLLIYPGEWVVKESNGKVTVQYASIIERDFEEVKEPPVFIPYSQVQGTPENPPVTYTFTTDASAGWMKTDPELKVTLDRIEKKLNILLKCKGLPVEE
jgi:hypothetical protein